MLLFIGALLFLFIVGIFVFIKTSKQFGERPQKADFERFSKSPQFTGEIFENPWPTTTANFMAAMRTLPRYFSLQNGSPKDSLPVMFGENTQVATDTACFVTWYGHSAFLFEIEGKRILMDPMLGESASPVSFFGKRFPYADAIPLDELVAIDAVIISHDHYDHLDYPSIVALKERVGHFYTPLGLGSHLKSWGVDASRITELDWWDEVKHDDLRIVACPSRHFSGRSIGDNNSTLWASWIIESEHHKLYFSGDGGYASHFKEIGEKEGPFDLAMMECGQYDSAWAEIHMMPEESVQAAMDLGAKQAMPIHWGAFQLGIHSWTDPIERFKKAGDAAGLNLLHPMIGERFQLGYDAPTKVWWED